MTIGSVDEVVEVELVNEFITGSIELTKVDEDYPDNKLTGAVFEVYADKNGDGKLDDGDELLGEMAELGDGVYQMSDLRYGKYLVRETKAPEGFLLDTNVYPVSIEEDGKIYTVENEAGVGFINAAQKGSLKIVKTSSDGKVEGFSFRVTGKIMTRPLQPMPMAKSSLKACALANTPCPRSATMLPQAISCPPKAGNRQDRCHDHRGDAQ